MIAQSKKNNGRMISSDDEDTTDDPVDTTPDTTAEPASVNLKETPPSEPLKPSKPMVQDSSTAQAIGRMVTGATPTLFSFLFGPQQAEKGISQTEKTFAAGKPAKLLQIIGKDGSPVYETPEGAIGEKVPQKQAKPSGASGLSNLNLVDRVSGKPTVGILDKSSGTIREAGTGVPLSMDKYAPAIDTRDTVKVTDVQGNESIKTLPKFGSMQSDVPLSKGYGSQYGLATEDVKNGNQMAQSYLKDSKAVYDSKASLRSAMDLLNSPDTDPIKQSAGIFRTAKAIVNERISDQERGVVTLPPGLLENLTNKIDAAMSNRNPQETLKQLRGVLIDLDSANDKALASMQDRYIQAYAAGDEKKAKFLSDKINSASKITVNAPTPPVDHRLDKEDVTKLTRGQKIKIANKIIEGRK